MTELQKIQEAIKEIDLLITELPEWELIKSIAEAVQEDIDAGCRIVPGEPDETMRLEGLKSMVGELMKDHPHIPFNELPSNASYKAAIAVAPLSKTELLLKGDG